MKKGLLVLGIACGALAVGGGVTYACVSKQASAYVNARASACAYESNATSNDVKEEWESFKNTYLIPLVTAGISVPTLVSIAGVVVNSVLKKKIKDKIKDSEAQQAKVNEALTKVSSLLEAVKNNVALTDEVKAELNQIVSSISNELKSNEKVAKKIEQLKQVNLLLINLEAKIASISDEVVKADIVSDINEIKSLASQIK